MVWYYWSLPTYHNTRDARANGLALADRGGIFRIRYHNVSGLRHESWRVDNCLDVVHFLVATCPLFRPLSCGSLRWDRLVFFQQQ